MRLGTAGDIINRAALEIGLPTAPDPFASQDESHRQLVGLLNACGEELATSYTWELLNREFQLTTTALDTGNYPLPADFLFMLPQTGWERSNQIPLGGPLSAQDWTYLKGRQLASTTIYASFRFREGLLSIYPQPPPANLDINFEYQSSNWVIDNTVAPAVEKDSVTLASDTVQFDKVLITRYLKVKYLEAKGLDAAAATDDFNTMFSFMTNLDKGCGEIISAGCGGRRFPYLGAYNLPDTGYGT